MAETATGGLEKRKSKEKEGGKEMIGDVVQVDNIICPECGEICKAEVKEAFPFLDFTHICEYCGYMIMESEWEVVESD